MTRYEQPFEHLNRMRLALQRSGYVKLSRGEPLGGAPNVVELLDENRRSEFWVKYDGDHRNQVGRR